MGKEKSFLSANNFENLLFTPLTKRNLFEESREQAIEKLRKLPSLPVFKHKSEGLETCFIGYFNGFILIVRTTFSRSRNKYIEHDTGWVMLIDTRRKEPFFSFEIRRSSINFFSTMISWVDVMIDIAMCWPTHGGTKLVMIQVKNLMHMRRFVHPDRRVHLKTLWVIELPLKKENSDFLIKKFGNFYCYRRQEENYDRQYRRIIRSKRTKVENPLFNKMNDDGIYYDSPYEEE